MSWARGGPRIRTGSVGGHEGPQGPSVVHPRMGSGRSKIVVIGCRTEVQSTARYTAGTGDNKGTAPEARNGVVVY